MKRALLLFAIVAIVAPQLFAQRVYRFRLLVTDGRTGLMMNPKFDDLHMPAEQLEKAKQTTVFSLVRIDGTHWTWTMLNAISPKDGSHPEVGFTDRSGGAAGPSSDFSLQLIDPSTVALRCWRSDCVVEFKPRDGSTSTVQLANREAITVPSDCEIGITFVER